MTALEVRVETNPSVSIREAAAAICKLAAQLDCDVSTEFNSIYLCASPRTHPDALVDDWDRLTGERNQT